MRCSSVMKYSKSIKARCVYLLVAVLFVSQVFAANSWRLITKQAGSHGPEMDDLQFTDSKHGWAVMPSGLLETLDGGGTWQTKFQSGIPERAFYSLAFVNPTIGWMVGLRSEKNGHLPLVLYTNDSGKSWQAQDVIISPSMSLQKAHALMNVKFCNPQEGWAVGAGIILHTSDAGKNWVIQRLTDAEELLLKVDCLDSQRAWVVGKNGLILNTDDSGKTWGQQVSPTKNDLFRVRHFDNRLWAVGANGTILYTFDWGKTWLHSRSGIEEGLTDIYLNGASGWSIGASGVILKTNDNGKTWQRQKSPARNRLNCLFFLNPLEGWIGGDNLTVLGLKR